MNQFTAECVASYVDGEVIGPDERTDGKYGVIVNDMGETVQKLLFTMQNGRPIDEWEELEIPPLMACVDMGYDGYLLY